MINLDTCNFIVYGFRNSYNTFGHIQEAWYRALKYKFPDRNVSWVDEINPEDADFSNALVLTVNVAGLQRMPIAKNAFYVIHNLDESTKALFGDIGDYSVMNYGVHTLSTNTDSGIRVGHDMFLYLQSHEKYTCFTMYWGTDLFPHEIEANKPLAKVFNPESQEINFVGTAYHNVHDPFARACAESKIKFNTIGGFTGSSPVSIEENARLVRASYMAPAVGDVYHNRVLYFPCRTAKNISYGMMPITNNIASKKLFPELIFNEDTYQLFFDAKAQLPHVKLETLHRLMDEVAQNHTYLTKLDGLIKAVKMTQEARG